MIETIPVTGCTGAECFLLVSENDAYLVDAGYAFSAEGTVKNIERALGSRPLRCILLTHSHYDHVNGLSAVKRRWPEAPVIASYYVKDIFAREGARRLMRALDDAAAAKNGVRAAQEDFTENLTPDWIVKEGDVLRIGDATIRVMETPGHTKCSVSYHFQEEDLLVLSETIGVRLRGGEVIPAFIVSYRDAMQAIERVESLAPQHILLSHSTFGVTSDEAVNDFLREARAAAQAAADTILMTHKQGKDFKEILDEYREKFYIGSCRLYQPLDAFLSNTRAMIPRLIAEAEEGL
jgi:glyoxylase-like metal-dependent hydrolase (beta-lactamase superfamily II)